MIIFFIFALAALSIIFIFREDIGFSVVIMITAIALLLVTVVCSIVTSTNYIEEPEHYEIEVMNSEEDTITVDGKEYTYSFKYDKETDVPYAVIAKKENDAWKDIMTASFFARKEKVYVYTNNIALTDKD